jgi:hypothetical protein
LAEAVEAVEAASAAEAKLDAHQLRADFPIFEQRFHGKPLAYLDSAVSAQKPRQVLDAQREFYETSYTNVHRGVYLLAERATEHFEGAREKVRAFINAASTREIVFTRSATEALNLVAYAWGLDNLGPGDLVVATELEHHSNFVPWQQLAKRTGATFRIPPPTRRPRARRADGSRGGPPRCCLNLVSNALGTSTRRALANGPGHGAIGSWTRPRPPHRLSTQAVGATSRHSGHKMRAERHRRCVGPPELLSDGAVLAQDT